MDRQTENRSSFHLESLTKSANGFISREELIELGIDENNAGFDVANYYLYSISNEVGQEIPMLTIQLKRTDPKVIRKINAVELSAIENIVLAICDNCQRDILIGGQQETVRVNVIINPESVNLVQLGTLAMDTLSRIYNAGHITVMVSNFNEDEVQRLVHLSNSFQRARVKVAKTFYEAIAVVRTLDAVILEGIGDYEE